MSTTDQQRIYRRYKAEISGDAFEGMQPKGKKPVNKMRKLLLLTILSLLLISCKNDNNKNPGLENSDQLDLTEVYPDDQYICDFINQMIDKKFQIIY